MVEPGPDGDGRPLVNYHFHDDASSDGAGSLAEHCRAAAESGIRHLCVTNHVEFLDEESGAWRVVLEEAIGRFSAEMDAARAVRETRPELDLRVGAELEYRPEWVGVLGELAEALPFDFLIGSVHVVDGLNISGGAEPDAYFSSRSQREAYGAYFETVREMVGRGGFDVVGHFDLIKRYGHLHHGPYDPRDFEPVIRDALAAMAGGGLGIEINTSGVLQPPGEPYPAPEILSWAREEGVPFLTLGSDSHAPGRLTGGLAEGYELARSTGWKELTLFEGRERSGAVPVVEADRVDRARKEGAGG